MTKSCKLNRFLCWFGDDECCQRLTELYWLVLHSSDVIRDRIPIDDPTSANHTIWDQCLTFTAPSLVQNRAKISKGLLHQSAYFMAVCMDLAERVFLLYSTKIQGWLVVVQLDRHSIAVGKCERDMWMRYASDHLKMLHKISSTYRVRSFVWIQYGASAALRFEVRTVW